MPNTVSADARVVSCGRWDWHSTAVGRGMALSLPRSQVFSFFTDFRMSATLIVYFDFAYVLARHKECISVNDIVAYVAVHDTFFSLFMLYNFIT